MTPQQTKLVREEAACWAVSHVNLAARLHHSEAAQNEDPDCRMTKYPVTQRRTQPVCQACLAESHAVTAHTHAWLPAAMIGLELLMDVIFFSCLSLTVFVPKKF